MKRICEFCKWFRSFYRSVGEGLYEPVDMGECVNTKFGEVDVVAINDECSDWEKQDGKPIDRVVGWTRDVSSGKSVD